jgi:signal transduction histidine kinase
VSPHSLAALLAFAIDVSLVVIIVLDDVRSRTNRLFALVVGCFALWNAADIVLVNASTPEWASGGGALSVAAFLFAPSFLLLLSFEFPRPMAPQANRSVVRFAILSLPLAMLLLAGLKLFTPIELEQVNQGTTPHYVTSAPGGVTGVLMLAFIFLCLTWGIVNFRLQLKHARSGDERRRIMPLLLGTGAAALLVATHEIFRAYDPEAFVYRSLSLLVSLLFAFVVLGNRLIILRRIGRQGVAYSVVTGLFFAFYIIVITQLADLISGQIGVGEKWVVLILVVVLAVSFRPLAVRVDTVVERVLSRNIFRYRRKINKFMQEAFQASNPVELEGVISTFLKESLSASWVDLLICANCPGGACSVQDPSRALSEAALRPLRETRENRVVNVEDLLQKCTDADRQMLAAATGGVVVPLTSGRGLAGVLLVGPTIPGRAFTLDEIDFLSIVGNGVSMAVERMALIARIRAEELRAVKMEKLASLGRLTAGIAHEFRNPLNIISTSAQTILRHPDDRGLHEETGRYILEETERLSRTVDEFLQFARPHTPVWERVNITETVDRAIQSLQVAARASHVEIRRSYLPSAGEIVTSPQHIERVLCNLGQNAIEAMPHGGTLTFEVLAKDESAMGITVRDTGRGIPANHHATLFDPFFTTKPNGTGLGLAIVFMLMQSLRGRITFASTPAGTAFHLELPIDGSRQ